MYEQVLRSVSFLSALSDYERSTVADALRSITYTDGDVIIREGDSPPTGMYIIERGAAKVTVRVHPSSAPATPATDGGAAAPPLQLSPAADSSPTIEKVVAWLGVGDYFGEYALLEDKPRTASVYAVATDSWLTDEDDCDEGATAKVPDELAGKVVVAFLERDSFERLLGPCREIMLRNTRSYTRSVSMSCNLSSGELQIPERDAGEDDDTFL
jgi:cAMP-dependent protein kinase regulator